MSKKTYKITTFYYTTDKEKNIVYKEYIVLDGGLSWQEAKETRKKHRGSYIVPEIN